MRFENAFKLSFLGRFMLGLVGLALCGIGAYCLAIGESTGAVVVGCIAGVMVLYMIIDIALEESRAARQLWPQLYIEKDAKEQAKKLISRIKHNSKGA